MTYKLPSDGNLVRFFGKKTPDGQEAYMPAQIVGLDGKTPISSSNPLNITGDVSLKGSNVKVPVDIQAQQTKVLQIVTNDDTNITANQTHTYYDKDGKQTWSYDRGNTLDVSNYKELFLTVVNNYDVAVKFNVFLVDFWGNIHYLINAHSVNSNSKVFLSSKDYPILNKPIYNIMVRVTTDIIPTTGTISFSVEGQ
ncbi:hypothetical protein [Pseudalkalibacillus caeni]|uniref:Uncharacterized protein n=1 Tax=Exobacillus caeni TaxID=2574798 RepID=A0A5R9FB18_9BACL|nr:hypothetical protein [Pseudalkalibacillus caeni]TLS37734.1 hypothetical protein FCL54_07885 [Pseudalkalibacillus caeni]